MRRTRNSAAFLPFCLASIALTPNESGQDGANVGRCFSLRLIIPVLIASRCFGFIPSARVKKQIYSEMATDDAVSSGELTSDPSYLDCSDINPRLLTACLSFSFSHYPTLALLELAITPATQQHPKVTLLISTDCDIQTYLTTISQCAPSS
jgi:hypothetical protein